IANGSSPTFSNCRIIDNQAATGSGGGFHCEGTNSPHFRNCIFSGNESFNAGGGGGALRLGGGNQEISNCTFAKNNAVEGGAILCAAATADVSNCFFVGNSATRGAVLYTSGATIVTLRNSLLSGNAAGDGSILYNVAGEAYFFNCTLSENHVKA